MDLVTSAFFFLSSLTPSFPFLLFSSTLLLPSPLPVFFSFFLWIYPRLASNSHSSPYLWISCPSTMPLHHGDLLTFSRRFYFYVYLPININKIQRNLHLNYFYYKDTSPFRLTARKNDLFLSIHWFSVEQKGHAFHSSARSSL